ncbi:MAG: DUF4249 domain-containing protein, partial [Bacteroidales bacterium]
MKRLNKLPFLLIFTLVIFLTSCEDVIQLELKNSATRVVIDATLNAGMGECNVLLTKSLDFYQTDSMAKIVGAKVELIDKSGLIKTLPEVKPGFYFTNGLTVGPGDVYRLSVTLPSGDIYSARTEVPVRVTLDSLKVVRGFGDPRPTSPPIFLLNPVWKDPAGIANYYRF